MATDYGQMAPEEAALTGMAVAVYAATRPQEVCVTDRFGQLTWRELNDRANQLAHYFRGLGMVEDEGVALLCSNRLEFVIVLMAVFRTGNRLTPINWHLTGEEVGYIVDNCDARVFVAETRFADVAREAASLSGKLRGQLSVGGDIPGFTDLATTCERYPAEDIENPLMGGGMLYTSGTTGRPKGVYRKVKPPVLPDHSATGYPGKGNVNLCTGPAYHAAPLLIDVITPLVSGVPVVFMDRWDPEETLRLIERHRVTHCHMVATMFHRLLQLPDSVRSSYDISSIRQIVHGAAPCPVHVKHAMIEWFGPVLLEYYAATEGGGGFLIDSHEWLRKPGSVGKPGPEFDNRILDDEGNPVGPGEVGTIYMRAPAVGRFNYYKDEAKTSSSYRGDYFTLGDMGYFDEDGYLFLTGRTAELIISGGVNIYPQEVDSEIMQHPAVRDVCTIGVPNEEWGEEVKSVVQLNEGFVPDEVLAEDLITFTRTRLPAFKCPRSITFAADLPRLPTGKIQRRLVREPFWAGRDRQI
ncbi:MAG: AMP-binding protein [Pseudomonadota bacterium]